MLIAYLLHSPVTECVDHIPNIDLSIVLSPLALLRGFEWRDNILLSFPCFPTAVKHNYEMKEKPQFISSLGFVPIALCTMYSYFAVSFLYPFINLSFFPFFHIPSFLSTYLCIFPSSSFVLFISPPLLHSTYSSIPPSFSSFLLFLHPFLPPPISPSAPLSPSLFLFLPRSSSFSLPLSLSPSLFLFIPPSSSFSLPLPLSPSLFLFLPPSSSLSLLLPLSPSLFLFLPPSFSSLPPFLFSPLPLPPSLFLFLPPSFSSLPSFLFFPSFHPSSFCLPSVLPSTFSFLPHILRHDDITSLPASSQSLHPQHALIFRICSKIILLLFTVLGNCNVERMLENTKTDLKLGCIFIHQMSVFYN